MRTMRNECRVASTGCLKQVTCRNLKVNPVSSDSAILLAFWRVLRTGELQGRLTQLESQHLFEETARPVMARTKQEFRRRSLLDDDALIHENDAVGEPMMTCGYQSETSAISSHPRNAENSTRQ